MYSGIYRRNQLFTIYLLFKLCNYHLLFTYDKFVNSIYMVGALVLCLVVSHTFPCSGYINQVEPTLTHQIPSPPTTTIPSSGTSGLGPCPRVPGACSRCWDDEGSQIASSCASIPGKFLLQHSSSSSILTQRFAGRRRVDAASGLQGAGYG